MNKVRITLGVISIFFTYLSIALTARLPSTSVEPTVINNGSSNSLQEHLEEVNNKTEVFTPNPDPNDLPLSDSEVSLNSSSLADNETSWDYGEEVEEQEEEDTSHCSQEQLENVKKIPEVFILNPDPKNLVVCYSGVSLNSSSLANNETSEGSGEKAEDTSQRNVTETFFSLRSHSSRPATCRSGPLPTNLTDARIVFGGSGEENTLLDAVSHFYCYKCNQQKKANAILYKTDPLQEDWIVLMGTNPFTYMTFHFVNIIGSINPNETVVECGDFGLGFAKGVLGAASAASLLG